MKKKLLVINIFLLLLLLLTNCGNHSSNLEGVNDNNETLNLYKEELCNLLSDYYLSASIDLNIETEYKEMFSSSIIKIKDSKNVIEAKENYNNSISELNNSFPYASGVIDYTNSNDKVNIYKAIEDYLIRNNLTKINILDSEGTTFSLNLNATNKQTWEYLFGENGSVIKTAKENYWEVEPALSNNFFVKALDLAINKNELSKILGLAPDTSTFPAYFRVDLNDTITYLEQTNQVKEYVFDIDEARKYFKLAMYELENQNLFALSKVQCHLKLIQLQFQAQTKQCNLLR